MQPAYEWDEVKRRSNRAKHRVDFTALEAFEWDTAIIELDDYPEEERWNNRSRFALRCLHRARGPHSHNQSAQGRPEGD